MKICPECCLPTQLDHVCTNCGLELEAVLFESIEVKEIPILDAYYETRSHTSLWLSKSGKFFDTSHKLAIAPRYARLAQLNNLSTKFETMEMARKILIYGFREYFNLSQEFNYRVLYLMQKLMKIKITQSNYMNLTAALCLIVARERNEGITISEFLEYFSFLPHRITTTNITSDSAYLTNILNLNRESKHFTSYLVAIIKIFSESTIMLNRVFGNLALRDKYIELVSKRMHQCTKYLMNVPKGMSPSNFAASLLYFIDLRTCGEFMFKRMTQIEFAHIFGYTEVTLRVQMKLIAKHLEKCKNKSKKMVNNS